jgi:hypothetical protein
MYRFHIYRRTLVTKPIALPFQRGRVVFAPLRNWVERKTLGIKPVFQFRHQVQCPIRTWLCPFATFDRSDESPQWSARCCGGRA